MREDAPLGIVVNLVRVGIVAITVVAVAELSKRYLRSGTLLLSLPIVSLLAILLSWFQHRDLTTILQYARRELPPKFRKNIPRPPKL